VIVVGGGIAGLLTSYFLSSKGYSVQVITESETSNTASWMNAGYIAASFGDPTPAIEGFLNIVRLALSKYSPVKVHVIYFLRNLLPNSWLWMFVKNSQKRNSPEHFKIVSNLCSKGAQLLQQIIDSNRLEVFLGKTILEVFLNEKMFKEYVKHLQKDVGYPKSRPLILTSSECLELEPMISETVVGGVLFEDDAYVDPAELMVKLKDFLENALGVIFKYGRVDSLETKNKSVISVRLRNGQVLTASHYVICCGVGAAPLLSRLGIRLPLTPALGYTVITEPHQEKLGRAVYGGEFGLAMSQTREGRIRMSGYFELGASPHSVLDKRCQAIKENASLYLPSVRKLFVAAKRFGARPCTPDGLPYVGEVGLENLTVNVGHCRLGLTTGAATAGLICDILEGVKNPFSEALNPMRMFKV